MGTYANWYAPPFTQVDDVAKCLGITLGLPGELVQTNYGTPLRVEGVQVKGDKHIAAMASIVLDDTPLVKGGYVTWHYEVGAPQHAEDTQFLPGSRLLMALCSPLWAAALTNLCELFGGIVDYNDCDDSHSDLLVSPLHDYSPQDGEDWDTWQKTMASIAVVTPEQMAGPWPVELRYE